MYTILIVVPFSPQTLKRHSFATALIATNFQLIHTYSFSHTTATHNETSYVTTTTLSLIMSNVVQEGDTVILSFAGDRSFFAVASTSSKLTAKIGKVNVPTAPLVSLSYGTVIELNNKTIFPASSDEIEPDLNTNLNFQSTQSKDNRDVNTKLSSTSQTLTNDDITKMKSEGSSGGDIVLSLCNSSTTFASKTDFSKAKYIKRKQQKYQPRARIVRCNASTICDVLNAKNAMKILSLRSDTLGSILTFGNVFSGMRTMVFDQASGMVVGSVAERMGGAGRIISIYTTQDPGHKDMMAKFNFSHAVENTIKNVSGYEIFNTISTADKVSSIDADKEQSDMIAQGWPVPLQEHTQEHMKTMANDEERIKFLEKRASRFLRKLTRPSVTETNQWLTEKNDSLIIACKLNPLTVLLQLLPYLKEGCPFVVYAEHIQSLVVTFKHLQDNDLAVKLQLSETWLREIQVLENRTHPTMNMSSTGGFLLTGIKISKRMVEVEQKGRFIGKGMAAFVYSGKKNNGKKRKIVTGDDEDEDKDGDVKQMKK